jgi:hypothetical protein
VPGPGEVVWADERETGKLAAATISKNEKKLILFTDCMQRLYRGAVSSSPTIHLC